MLNKYIPSLTGNHWEERFPDRTFVRHAHLMSPEGALIVSVSVWTPNVMGLLVQGHHGLGCVIIVEAARLHGMPTYVMSFRLRDSGAYGLMAEWVTKEAPADATIRNRIADDITVEGYMDFKQVELDAEAYLESVMKNASKDFKRWNFKIT